MKFWTLVIASGAVWVGCPSQSAEISTAAPSSAQPVAPARSSPPAPTDQNWSLVALGGVPVSVPNERARPSLLLTTKEGRATGMAGVNRFGGTYTLQGDSLKFGPLMATKMAGPPELNELETRYLRLLGQTSRWRMTNDALELLAGEEVLARFIRM